MTKAEGEEKEEAILQLRSLHDDYKAWYRSLLRNFSMRGTYKGEIHVS